VSGFDFVLGNRYRLLSPLGEGGMASVFAATDERLGRRVAVKILADNLVTDPQFVKRFQQEAESAARLSHPNIVSVYDVGEDGSRRYIVMELVNGRNLKDILEERGALSAGRALSIAGQVLDGLEYAHQHGLIHRDIKPQNILLTRDGSAKLADFGIAKAVDVSSATQTAVVLGSAHYLSPEQARGEPVTPAADVYSMGVVIYEMCTGHLPFQGSNLLAVAASHIHDEPAAPSTLRDDLSRQFDAVVLRALAKTPEERYQSAALLKEALEALPVAQEPKPSVEEDLTEVRRPLEPVRAQERAAQSERTIIRPTILRFVLWAAFIAVVALLVDRAPGFLPSGVAGKVPATAYQVLAVIVALAAVGVLVLGVLERFRQRYTIDEHAVTVETGLLSHHRDAVPLSAVVNLQLHQSPVSRLLNLGTIVLTTTQSPGHEPVSLRLRDVSHASRTYDTVIRRIGGASRLRFEAPPLDELSL